LAGQTKNKINLKERFETSRKAENVAMDKIENIKTLTDWEVKT
jgi:hypothetical protein